MSDSEVPLTPIERLAVAALYARLTAATPSSRLRLDSGLTSKDVLHPRQHPEDGMNTQVAQSHILVSHPKSHNQSHQEAS
ncbi:Uncharacterised protein [Mycobacteroides abscessus subsp. abscessus]|nr:Uncharacterised protein [Mycobacteroides abscessus subsp. abscessus]SIF70603.1 Uncharacterised protein [Mycobacteroides abscessus subsp. abscessus]SIF74884.1 Uncharacterised protein [Mycobacteroides abscessus subsp. abscessus]SIF78601.1 Uncharacterised protein [Mycobacteroides abscessus subsp. abscessus]SIG13760.1 Uncharacterised protein [Mycobacteroides abscessus subsp. abscessus]